MIPKEYKKEKLTVYARGGTFGTPGAVEGRCGPLEKSSPGGDVDIHLIRPREVLHLLLEDLPLAL